MQKVFPLSWPANWDRSGPKNDLGRVLLGFPLFGPERKVFKHICGQLAKRSGNCTEQWGRDRKRMDVVERMARILQEWFHWPNRFFIPDDPFEILFWDARSYFLDDLSTVSAITAIEDTFPITLDEHLLDEWVGVTFGHVVDDIRSRIESSSPLSLHRS